MRAAAAKAIVKGEQAGIFSENAPGVSCKPPDAAEQVASLLDDDLVRVRLMGVKSCGKIFAARKKGGGKKKKQRFAASEAAVAYRVIERLADADADVRLAAISALSQLGSGCRKRAVEAVTEALDAPGEAERRSLTVRSQLAALVGMEALTEVEGIASSHREPLVQRTAAVLLAALEESSDEVSATVLLHSGMHQTNGKLYSVFDTKFGRMRMMKREK